MLEIIDALYEEIEDCKAITNICIDATEADTDFYDLGVSMNVVYKKLVKIKELIELIDSGNKG